MWTAFCSTFCSILSLLSRPPSLSSLIRLKDEERRKLATIGKQIGGKALGTVAMIVKPDTILRWHAKLVARKFDGSGYRRSRGRASITQEVEALILRGARENRSWRYDRISGALMNLGHRVSDTTVGNVLRRHRFLHHGIAVLLRTSYLLHSLLHPSWFTAGAHRGEHTTSSQGLDDTDSAQHHRCRGRHVAAEQLQVSHPRS